MRQNVDLENGDRSPVDTYENYAIKGRKIMEFNKYRKTALTDIAQWNGEIITDSEGIDLIALTPDRPHDGEVYDYLHKAWIPLNIGDYIARGARGEHYPIAASVMVDGGYEQV
jgi:hypothetical protein